jgi:hypothetical protein
VPGQDRAIANEGAYIVPNSADARNPQQLQTQEADVVLLASEYDKSKYLKAEDLPHEKKFRIKNVTEESVGVDREKEQKLVV